MEDGHYRPSRRLIAQDKSFAINGLGVTASARSRCSEYVRVDRKNVRQLIVAAGGVVLIGGGAVLWAGGNHGGAEASATVKAVETPIFDDDMPSMSQTPEPEKAKTKEEKRFARADRDDDGKITLPEYLTNRRRNFDKLDSNSDGKLSFDEYSAAGKKKFGNADSNYNGILDQKEYATTAVKPKPRQMASLQDCKPTPTSRPFASDHNDGDEPNLND